MKSIDMYIGYDRRVGVCFLKRSRIGHSCLRFQLCVSPFPARWLVGHDYLLVLVFAATCKDSALPTNQQGADTMLFFFNLSS